ncbi:MAG: cysteine--tRNA ligase [Proteobacteria bacterium]|nr:cysteine--tRNA ligase [Pseudomonadota bacterium]
MTLRIYNTLSGKKEDFIPLVPGKVGMYVCGPTVYDSCHIGHARSVVVFDLILRYFEKRDFDVTYIRNFTDIDDKIINRANELAVGYKDISEKYIAEFYEDMDALNVKRASIEPRATEHIKGMISLISGLINKGKAYAVDGDVFFSVETFGEYGKLSGRQLQDMEAGARIDVDDRKKNPFDFALWKSSKPHEPYWESPWGKGRPGWHIECSVMSSAFLGDTFDIHGGGKDLIFPHHENEIAQSECATGKKYARYWIHNGFININQEKMSKSLGNFKTIKDILKSYHPEAVRLFLLSSHYRSPIDFSDQSMDEATLNLEKIYTLLKRVSDIIDPLDKTEVTESGAHWIDFCEAMDDDFNSAKGIAVIFEAIRHMNRVLDDSSDQTSSQLVSQVAVIYRDIIRMTQTIGIAAERPDEFFKKKIRLAVEEKSVDVAVVERMIKDRNDARKAKDFTAADRIRDELQKMNIEIKDGPSGTTWSVAG